MKYKLFFITLFLLIEFYNLHAQVWPLQGETPKINSSYGTFASTHDNTHFHPGIDIPGESGVSRVVTLGSQNTIYLVQQQEQSINIYTYNPETEEHFIYAHCEELNFGINLYNGTYANFSTPHTPTSSSLTTINGEGMNLATLADYDLDPIIDNSVDPPTETVGGNTFGYDHLHLGYGHGTYNSDGNFTINLVSDVTNPLEMAIGDNSILSTADPGNNPPELGSWFVKRVLNVSNAHLYIKKNDPLRKGAINGKIRIMREITDIMNSYNPNNPDESTPPKKEDADTWDETMNKIYDANIGSPYKVEFGIQNNKDVFIWEKQYFQYTGGRLSAATNSLLYDSNPTKIVGGQYKYVYNLTNINTTNVAEDKYWNTKLKQGVQWNEDDATNITDARYPDDKYKLWVRAADIVAGCNDVSGHFAEEELEVIVDNFRPWIKSAMVYDADGLIAAQHWEFYESVDIMCLWEDITPTPTDGTSPLQIIVNSSEPMEYLHLAIPAMGISNVIGTPTDENRMVWSFTVGIPSSAVDDEYDLSITGQDYNGNELEALQDYEPNDCIFPDDLPSSRDEDGNWSPEPIPGSDMVHSFLLENCPSANTAPTIVPEADYIEQDVCIGSNLVFISSYLSDDTDLPENLNISVDHSTLPLLDFDFSDLQLGFYLFAWEDIGEGYLGTHTITVTVTDNDPDCPRSSTFQHIVHVTCGEEGDCAEECPEEPCSDLVVDYQTDLILVPDCANQVNVPVNDCWGETISIEVSGYEDGNYLYSWSDCSNCNTPVRDLLPGIYTVDIEADNGCSESLTIVVDGDDTTDGLIETHEEEDHLDHGDTTIPDSELNLKVFDPVPNPFTDLIELSYVIADKTASGDSNPVLQTSHVKIKLYDLVDTHMIGTLYESNAVPVGKTQTFTYDGSHLRRGSYLFIIEGEGGVRGKVIIKM